MKAFIGIVFVVCLVGASEVENKVQSESLKQEKRSLSHGVLGGGYSSSYPSYEGHYGGSYGLTGLSEPSIVSSSGPISVSSGGYPGEVISSGPSYSDGAILSGGSIGGPILSGGAVDGGVVSAGSAVGISTNTNTLTTVRQNVPVPVAVDRPVPV